MFQPTVADLPVSARRVTYTPEQIVAVLDLLETTAAPGQGVQFDAAVKSQSKAQARVLRFRTDAASLVKDRYGELDPPLKLRGHVMAIDDTFAPMVSLTKDEGEDEDAPADEGEDEDAPAPDQPAESTEKPKAAAKS